MYDDKLNVDDLQIFKFPSNHSDDNLVILDKKSNTLFLGDALCGKIIDFEFIEDINVLKEQLSVLNDLDFTIAIESHQKLIKKDDLIIKLQTKAEK